MRLPSLRKHKTGQGFFTLHGHDYYCGVWGKPETQSKYERLLSEYLANKHSFMAAKSQAVKSVEDLGVSYLEYAKQTYEGGEYNNIKLIVSTLLDLYRELPANDFGCAQFKTFRAKSAAEKIKKERSRQYVNKCMRLIIRMFGWCTGEELVEARVVAVLREIAPLKLGRTDSPESEPVEEVDTSAVAATLPHLPPVVADMDVLQQLVGCSSVPSGPTWSIDPIPYGESLYPNTRPLTGARNVRSTSDLKLNRYLRSILSEASTNTASLPAKRWPSDEYPTLQLARHRPSKAIARATTATHVSAIAIHRHSAPATLPAATGTPSSTDASKHGDARLDLPRPSKPRGIQNTHGAQIN